jgi:shikimate 5-dehydrogenase
MLVGQARAQFEHWTGVPAPDGLMEHAAAEFLGRHME